MKKRNESGRSMAEMLAVLAIVSVLSVGAISGLRQALMKQKVNNIIHAINLGSVQILSSLGMGQRFETPEQMDAYLSKYTMFEGDYKISFKAPQDADREFSGSEFVAEITDKNGARIKGAMCRKLLIAMVKVNGVSDIDFSVNNEKMPDGSVEDVTMRLSGKAVDLNALCGKDVL